MKYLAQKGAAAAKCSESPPIIMHINKDAYSSLGTEILILSLLCH